MDKRQAPRHLEHNPFQARVHMVDKEGDTLAYVTVTISGIFTIRGVRVMKGKEGPFVAMPAYRSGEQYRDICYPCTKGSRASFDSTVLRAYDQAFQAQQDQILKKLASLHAGM